MNSTKVMLSAVMVMLLSIFIALVDIGRNTWLSGVSIILVVLAIIIFIVGLFIKKYVPSSDIKGKQIITCLPSFYLSLLCRFSFFSVA